MKKLWLPNVVEKNASHYKYIYDAVSCSGLFAVEYTLVFDMLETTFSLPFLGKRFMLFNFSRLNDHAATTIPPMGDPFV